MPSAPDVVVIGAGIVGACCAYELVGAGARVTVVERGGGWAEGCSWGNAGLLVPSHARPIAAPENLRAGLRWMLRRDSPFGLRPRAALVPWLARYAAASTARRAAAGEALQRSLAVEALRRFDALVEAGVATGVRRSGCLSVHRSPEHAAAEAASETGRALGARVLDAAEARGLEPALTEAVAAGVLFPHEAHCDPGRLAEGIGAAAVERGAELRTGAEAVALSAQAGGVSVRTRDGELRAGHAVLAAGVWSGALARAAGVPLPLIAGKGYAVDFDPGASPLRIPLYLHDDRCVANPMPGRLRLTGGLVLGGLDQRGDPRRAGAIRRAAAEMLGVRAQPRLTWSGLRPCTPDGLPVIGAHGRASTVVLATGHGMLGVTLGPLTGRLVADVVAGRADHPALPRLSPERFGR
jgi:D-amino-acid dehydrogenase